MKIKRGDGIDRLVDRVVDQYDRDGIDIRGEFLGEDSYLDYLDRIQDVFCVRRDAAEMIASQYSF